MKERSDAREAQAELTQPSKPREHLEYWQLKNEHGDILRVESIRGSFNGDKDKLLQVIDFAAYQALGEKCKELEGDLVSARHLKTQTYQRQDEKIQTLEAERDELRSLALKLRDALKHFYDGNPD